MWAAVFTDRKRVFLSSSSNLPLLLLFFIPARSHSLRYWSRPALWRLDLWGGEVIWKSCAVWEKWSCFIVSGYQVLFKKKVFSTLSHSLFLHFFLFSLSLSFTPALSPTERAKSHDCLDSASKLQSGEGKAVTCIWFDGIYETWKNNNLIFMGGLLSKCIQPVLFLFTFGSKCSTAIIPQY